MLPEQLWNEYSPLAIFPLPGLGDSSIARQIIAKSANAAIESADRNPFREYTYRQMSANRWQNPDFQNYATIVAQYFLMRAQNTNNTQAEIDNGVRLIYNGLVSKNALEFYSNILDNNQLRECSNYLDNLNKIMQDIAVSNGILPPPQQQGYRGQANPQYNQQYNNQYSRNMPNQPITGHREYNNRYNSKPNVNNQSSGVNVNIDSKSTAGYNRYSDNSNNVTPSQLNRFQKIAQENTMDMEQHKLYSDPNEAVPAGIKGNLSSNSIDVPKIELPSEVPIKSNPFIVKNGGNPIFTNSFKASLIDISSEFQKQNTSYNVIGFRNVNVVNEFPLTKELPEGFDLLQLFRKYFANKINKSDLDDILKENELVITIAFRYLCRLMTKELNYLFNSVLQVPHLTDDFYEDQPDLIKLAIEKKGAFLDLYKAGERLIKNWELANEMKEEISHVSTSALTLCESNIILTTSHTTEAIRLNGNDNESICMIANNLTTENPIADNQKVYKGIIGDMLEKATEYVNEKTVKNVYLLTKDFNVIPIHFYLNVASATIL